MLRFEGHGNGKYDVMHGEKRVGGVALTDYDYMARARVEAHIDILTHAFDKTGFDGVLKMLGHLINYRWDGRLKSIRSGVDFDESLPLEDRLNKLKDGLKLASLDELF